MKHSHAAGKLSKVKHMNFPIKPSIVAGRSVKGHEKRHDFDDYELGRGDGERDKAAYFRARQQVAESAAEMRSWSDEDEADIDMEAGEASVEPWSRKRTISELDDWIDAEQESLDAIEAEHEFQRMLCFDDALESSR
jgi:hypothetical protein